MITIPKDFRPMLSAKIKDDRDLKKMVHWPYVASPKLDGIRIFLHPELGAVTRTIKQIPNRYLQNRFRELLKKHPQLAGTDGEIVWGTPNIVQSGVFIPHSVFQDTTSAVMSHDGEPTVTFYIFDAYEHLKEYVDRQYTFLTHVVQICNSYKSTEQYFQVGNLFIATLEFTAVKNMEEVDTLADAYFKQGFEGLMLRDPKKPYRFGRSSMSMAQQHLIKIKPFEDCECEIIGFEEGLHNENELECDAFGLAKRSSKKEGKIAASTLGKFNVRALNGPFMGAEFNVGTGLGLTHELRQKIWNEQAFYMGRTITIYFQLRGSKDVPRIPIFKGFRED